MRTGSPRSLAEPSGARNRDEWLGIVGDCQSLINTLTAVQDAAIAEAARRESVWCEDGTLGESVHALGRVSLDAADLVAPVIGASHPQAQRRVEQAVRLAAGRVPVPADDRDLPEASGLGGLHQAMAAGHLDGYRAGVVAFELEVAPADVADAVVCALSGRLGDDATTLRRRTRVLLERISPDLVRERAKRARARTGLRRWVAEPGVDEWHGTFPSEDAAAAWAAIDKLAHDLVAAGTCTNVEQARGKALTDLVTGNATVQVQVVLTVPATTGNPDRATGAPQPAATGTTAGEPQSAAALEVSPDSTGHAHDVTATVADQQVAECEGDAPVPISSSQSHPDAPAEHAPLPAASGVPSAHPVADGLTSGHDDDLVEVQGARPSEPLLVRRGWLRDHLTESRHQPRRGAEPPGPPFVPCDPRTGARLDPGDELATGAYRPGGELAALVRARDGRCRFPGCSVAARFCDLDHVRPWPTGPTTSTNLLTLCRRHHRIKQRPGWGLRLAPDGTATWTDPTGRARSTAPLDALRSLVLAADPAEGECRAAGTPATADHGEDRVTDSTTMRVRPDRTADDAASEGLPAWSALETHLELRLEHRLGPRLEHGLRHPPTHRRCTSAAALRAALDRRRARAPVPDVPPF